MFVFSPPVQFTAPDVPHPYRQSSHFLYLTGYQEPHSVLAITGGHTATTLFVSKRIPSKELWDGPMAGVDDAQLLTGVERVADRAQFASVVNELLAGKKQAFFHPESLSQTSPNVQEAMRGAVAAKKMQFVTSPVGKHARFIHDLFQFPFIDRLRVSKSPAEQALQRRACRIGAAALTATMATGARREPCVEK